MGPIAKSTIQTSFVLGLRLLIQAGTLLLVARMLGPNEFGIFAGVAALAVLIGTFSTFGTHLVLLGEMSKDPHQREHILSYAVPTTLISGSLLFALYLGICKLLFADILLPLSISICIGVTEIILLPLYVLPTMEFLALGKTARSQLITIFPLGLRMLVAIGILISSTTEPLLIFAWLYMAIALLALVLMKWNKSSAWLSVKQWRIATRAELKHSAGYAALAMTAAGPSEIDKMLAVKLLPLGVTGVYIAASRVIGAATLPVIALLLSAMPRLFRYRTEKEHQSHHLIKWVFFTILLYGLILTGLLWLTAPLIEKLFGEKYVGIAQMVQFLCLVTPGMALRQASSSILMTLGLPWVRAMIEFLGMLALVLFAVIFSYFSVEKSVALAFILCELSISFVSFIYIYKAQYE